MSKIGTRESFIIKAKKIHNNRYDYSKVEYFGSKSKVLIICLEHGGFYQTPNNHLMGKRCKKCTYPKRPDLSNTITPEGSKAVPVGIHGLYALVDECDYSKVSEIFWRLTKKGYAYNRSVGYMHRFLMGVDGDCLIDHKDRNRLNNRLDNLRKCNHKENTYNSKAIIGTSSYKGVSWDRIENKWRAQINIDGKKKSIGRFDKEIDAAKAYNEWANKIHGEFANLNTV